MQDETVDVAVVGAGLSGIALARFYLDVHPDCRLVIVEKDAEIGGVWSQKRIFDGFWTQSPLRMTSFSDVPLTPPLDAPRLHDTFEAKHVTRYLENYVDSHIYQGTSLRDRIRLVSEVTSLQKIGSVWHLHIQGSTRHCLRCRKLAIATGLTSFPNMPTLPRDSQWSAPVLHHRDFGAHTTTILAPETPYNNITVMGGGKSAADMVYACLKARRHVSWLIRKSGEGPGIFMNPAASGRYRNNAEAGVTQNAGLLNPSGFHPLTSWAQLLHQSDSGRIVLNEKLFASDRRYKAWADYRNREGALDSFRELEPSASFFWNSGPIGMIQHDDFWDIVSHKVDVFLADPIGTTASSILLDDGREVPTDTLLCGMGWSSAYPFLSSEQAYELGLPHQYCQDRPEEAQSWGCLMDLAEDQIMMEFPILANPPPSCKPGGGARLTPARLYQGIAPLNDQSVVFLGRARLSNNFRGSEAQAIWATAYWDGHVKMPPIEQTQRHVAYMNAFSRKRYPSRGADGVNFHTDLVWYTDQLLHESGLTSHRKGWWHDPDEPYLASDYKDCAAEYVAKYGSG